MPPFSADDERFMKEALAFARIAFSEQEVPVGAVVVREGRMLGRGRNRREGLQDPTHHAEIEALREAAAAAGSWRLDGATLYVTLEPCPMCAGAAVNARLARIVFGCADPKAGYCGTLLSPVHSCLVMSTGYFKSDLVRPIRRMLVPCAIILATAVGLVFLYASPRLG